METLAFGPWKATVSYGLRPFGPGVNPPGNPEPTGRAFIAQLGPDEFLAGGFFCRVDFQVNNTSPGKQKQYTRVEEGAYKDGTFTAVRIWNGDQTDWGLNFSSVPQVLRIKLSTF